ncbi:MAG: ATP-binding cassette domain-containing protein [Hahellaceae bacterium]|nr:ATP-binding cassette domain-containing protein [Hahellaceae bacterium]MCP5211545.1 ATP-binding cassette domain-containing protein [Hahellaceae bacterium]
MNHPAENSTSTHLPRDNTVHTSGTFRRLLQYALQNKPLLWVAAALLLLATATDVLGPILLKIFIDDYLVAASFPFWDLLVLLVLYLAANIGAAWFGYLQSIKLGAIAQNVIQQIRQDIFAKVIKLPVSEFDFTPTGSLISRITNDTESIKELFVGVLGVYIQNSVKVLGIFIAMAFLNWQMMLVCLAFIPMVVTVMVVYRRISTPVFQKGRQLLSEINAKLGENLQGIRVIQAFNQQQRFSEDFNDTVNRHLQVRRRTMQLDALLLRPMVDMMHMLTLAGLLYYFGINVLESTIEVGILYAFINYLGRFTEPLIEMTQRLNLFQQSMVSAERVFQWIDRKSERLTGDLCFSNAPSKLELRNVNFSYTPNNPVLKDINVTFEPGSFNGIVGHTGSGKSTIASLIMRFYQPESGQIAADDRPLARYSDDAFRKQFALVQQDSFIFSGSILDNIVMGRNICPEQITLAVSQAGLNSWVERLPQKLAFQLTERGANISAGQRQLISIARTLAGNPKVIILDEATANIDSETETIIKNALLQLKGKATIIAVAHRLSTIKSADQILVMHQGKVTQQGNHESLITMEGLYRHLHQMQSAQWQLLEQN